MEETKDDEGHAITAAAALDATTPRNRQRSQRAMASPYVDLRRQSAARVSTPTPPHTPMSTASRSSLRTPGSSPRQARSTETSPPPRMSQQSPVRYMTRLQSAMSTVSSSPSTTPSQVGHAATQNHGTPPGGERRYCLTVMPFVKQTINQHDKTSDELAHLEVTGLSFQEIIRRLWDNYSSRIKGYAMKIDGVWTTRELTFDEWPKAITFKCAEHRPPKSRQETHWNAWLQRVINAEVFLHIYEYGSGIGTNKDLTAYRNACVLPAETDRSGAAAEVVQQELIERLQQRWRSELQATGVAWRLWANDIARTRDQTTWESLINKGPPGHMTQLFTAPDSRQQQHTQRVRRTCRLALDMVEASREDLQLLRGDIDMYRRRLDEVDSRLVSRKRMIEGFMADLSIPPASDIDDPFERIENVEDLEHQ